MAIVTICVASCLAAASQEPPRLAAGLVGRWDGTIDVNGTALPFSVTFAAPSGELTGTIDVKAHKASPLVAISVTGSSVHFELQAARPAAAVFDGTIQGDSMSGAFAQGRALGTFSLRRVDAAAVAREAVAAAAAATPAVAATAAPYRSEEVTFANGAVKLAGTLTIPEGKGPFRALVMVTGSGAQNRDEELFGSRSS